MPEPILTPSFLRKGDCIGIFAPSGPIRDPDQVKAGIHVLEEMGFRTLLPSRCHSPTAYLAADDNARLDEFHSLLANDDVAALIAVRGGYGSMRIIPGIDFGRIRAARKLLIGFSDVSALLNAVSSNTGLVTLHGPVVSSLDKSSRETRQALAACLAGTIREYDCRRTVEILGAGNGTGILRGGNLTTMVHLLGTPWEISWAGSILFLEDTGEPMYKIDRKLTQLDQAGRLSDLAGLLLGTFDEGGDTAAADALQEQVWERVLELVSHYGYPVWGRFPTGHLDRNLPLPIGMPARMDSDRALLIFERPPST